MVIPAPGVPIDMDFGDDDETRFVAPPGPVVPGNTKFFLIGVVDDTLVDKFVGSFTQAIDEQKNLKNGRLTLYIQGPGGYWSACSTILSLIEIAKASGIVIRTVVTGEVASASSVIAVAGTPGHRYISDVAEHMLHYGWTSTEGETPMEIDRANEQAKRFFRAMAAHYAKHCAIPNLDKNFQYDQFYITAKQCLRWKLADKPLEAFEP